MNGLMPRLEAGLRAMGLDADSAQKERLLAYLAMLGKWNRVYNLTAIDDPEQMLVLHLLDSLSLQKHLDGTDCLDVGTGAGLPGIPLAIMNPQKRFYLLDASARKIRFVQQVVIELQLPNVVCLSERIESFVLPDALEQGFDVIMSRAYAALPLMVSQARRLLADRGAILAQKGRMPEREIETLSAPGAQLTVIELKVPDLDAERHLVRVSFNC